MPQDKKLYIQQMSCFPSNFILAYLLSNDMLRGHNCTPLSGWLLNSTTSRSFSWAVGRTGQARTDCWASCRQLNPHTAQNTRWFLLRAYGRVYWRWPWPLLPPLLLFLSLLFASPRQTRQDLIPRTTHTFTTPKSRRMGLTMVTIAYRERGKEPDRGNARG